MEALLATLELEGEAEIARVGAEARTRAAAMTAAADERIARRRRDALGARESERRAAMERALAQTRFAARRTVLGARDRLLDRFFAAVRAALPEIAAGPAYRAALERELTRARTYVGDAAATLRCAPALAPLLERLVGRDASLSVRADPAVAAGFRVATADGLLEVDATLEGRAERARPRLAIAALSALGVGA